MQIWWHVVSLFNLFFFLTGMTSHDDCWRSSDEGFCIVCEVSVCFGHTLTVFIFVFEYTLYGDIQSTGI